MAGKLQVNEDYAGNGKHNPVGVFALASEVIHRRFSSLNPVQRVTDTCLLESVFEQDHIVFVVFDQEYVIGFDFHRLSLNRFARLRVPVI